jgi:uncharacterized membrane protein YbhN (UPF0104 family)
VTAALTDRRPGGPLRHAVTRPVVRLALSLGVVVAVFAGVLPKMADYADAWSRVRDLTTTGTVAIAAVAAVNLLSYAPLWMAALPGLTLWRAVMVDSASTAIANTVPAGFAFGVGTNVAMFHSFGFSPAVITRAIALTGIWNNLVKLAMPALALGGLLLVSPADAGLAVAAVLGIVVLVVVAGLLLAGLTHQGAGAAMAAAAERLATRPARWRGRPRPTGWVARTERFRVDSLELLRHRWGRLTVAAIASHVALFLVLLACLRAVGGNGPQLHWVVVLAVFAVTRLVTLVPITPGALGVAELSYVAGLTAAGMEPAASAAAVLLFRFLTWFVPIPLGLGSWLLWRRGVGRVAPPAPPATPRPELLEEPARRRA